ncbi:hypothetical protein DLAC_08576 [Tieghemostelium lacteum]|uniref:Uncharacterized protein n=1 Tax=Tieghemostelium lacteum TaxID=361077 RepID=A0A151Z7R6_TIELA|nr:hypothetical protein DLAC_08576 [Tieghemostelium lacteum]|eukprot:KYQ90002.1 hypothetical protein DLAC_08576 [Tieghemostelium lacteum]
MNFLIPIGYIARNEKNEQSSAIRFYTDEVTLDSSVFICKSMSRISFLHIDSRLDNSNRLKDINNEIEYAQQNNSEKVKVFRCYNKPASKEAKEKQMETNHEIESIWIDLQKQFPNVEYIEMNVIETVSISLLDSDPLLIRIPIEKLEKSNISQKLINAISLIHDFMYPSSTTSTENNTNSNETKIIFENQQWSQDTFNNITNRLPSDNRMLQENPNDYENYLEAFLKIHTYLSAGQLINYIDQLFESINIYRESLGKSTIKKLKVGNNDNCPCTKVKPNKFKKCHGANKFGLIRKHYYSY